jgi:molybdopterin/thiamine biosynthesis adenylyltransferase
VGTAVALALHEAGIGEISCNDPQMFELEQLDAFLHSRRSDLGKPKVHVLERFLDGRLGPAFLPLVAPNESPRVEQFLETSDAIVSCANHLGARLHIERAAVRLGKPCIQACVQDARSSLGGIVSVWMPGLDSACFGCLFPSGSWHGRRNESLPPTVTRLVASVAANVTVGILIGAFDAARNLLTIDARITAIDVISVRPRLACSICGIPYS